MPYIKKEFRQSSDYIVNMVIKNDLISAIAVLREYKKTLPLDKIDGTMNYIFTKLLKNNELCYSIAGLDLFIKQAIKDEYLENRNYFSLQRLIGLLICMEAEFIERGWKQDEYIKNLSNTYIEAVLIPYENRKRKENGDID